LPALLPPTRFTSSKSRTYASLASAGGAAVRNCETLVSANGVTVRQCGAAAKSNGFVKRYWPGCLPSAQGSLAALPSLARLASTAAAAALPTRVPSSIAGPMPGVEQRLLELNFQQRAGLRLRVQPGEHVVRRGGRSDCRVRLAARLRRDRQRVAW
jgi:hypothetical protein